MVSLDQFASSASAQGLDVVSDQKSRESFANQDENPLARITDLRVHSGRGYSSTGRPALDRLCNPVCEDIGGDIPTKHREPRPKWWLRNESLKIVRFIELAKFPRHG